MFAEICSKLNFPKDSIPVLHEARLRIQAQPDAEHLLNKACACLVSPGFEDSLKRIEELSEKVGMHPYTVAMVVFLCAIPTLQNEYDKHAISKQVLWDSMMDLTYKLYECKKVEGIWGTAVASWHTRFYQLQLFKLGRLEFEKIDYRWDKPYAGISETDPVINIHIPSSGSLPLHAVTDSLRRAYMFYEKAFPDGMMPFVCSSWLLYPPMYTYVFPEDSNLRRFFECFDIVDERSDPQNKDFWRICDRHYTDGVLDKITPQTALQRNLVNYLKSGGTMGMGKGAFFFDGEHIIRR